MATSDIQTNPTYNNTVSQMQNTSQTNSATSTTEKTDNSAMGKDDFLKLLVTSLMYQDPMSPMETGDMMQQMAMLGLMEQTTNMRTALDELAKSNELSKWQEGSNILGKTVDAYNVQGEEVTGVVKEILNYDGSLYFITDTDTFEVGNIISLKNAASTEETSSTSSDEAMVRKAIQQIEESKSTGSNSSSDSSASNVSNTSPISNDSSIPQTSSSTTPNVSTTSPSQTTDTDTNQNTAQDEYTIGDLNQLLS
ncbi:hypothetical protein CN918_27685 [Priestia megaterium]|nr:hypothetical protein CN918_27685 [Priestia megaterium]